MKVLLGLAFLATISSHALAYSCERLPGHQIVAHLLERIVSEENGGIFKPNAMWASLVDRDGRVCVIAKAGDPWPGSRLIAAEKAYTANAFSNSKLALSTANLYFATQPGSALFGLASASPVNPDVAFKSTPLNGTVLDSALGKIIGGTIVFGGGLPLYDAATKLPLGGLGVSGDTACVDHLIAWKLRKAIQMDQVPGGVTPQSNDDIIYDLDPTTGKSPSGFGHPRCSP